MSTNPLRFPGNEAHFDQKPIRKIVADLIVQTAEEVESERLEIKDWCKNEQELSEKVAEACACIANTYGGYVLVGVANKIQGQRKFSKCPYPNVSTSWLQSRIYDLSRPPIDNIAFDASALLSEMTSAMGHNLYAIRVPRTRFVGGHVTTRGISKVRVGKECVPQYTAEDDRTSAPAPGVRVDDLSTASVDWAMAQHQRHYGVPCTWANRHEFLEQERLIRPFLPDEDTSANFQVSLAALLLFGKVPALQRVAPFFETTIITDKDSNPIRIRKNIIDTVRELCFGETALLLARLPQIPDNVIKELVVNAYVHRCYRVGAGVMINISDMDGLEIKSPGGLLTDLSVRNLIYGVPVYRNLLLANGARFAGLCDKIGKGIDIIFKGVLSEGLPFPEFESADNNFTARVALAGSSHFKQFLRTRSEILSNLDEVIVLRVLWAKNLASLEDLCVSMQRKPEFGSRVLDVMTKKNMIEYADKFFRLTIGVRRDIENIFQAGQLSLEGM